jgi:plasmid stability protein
MLMPDLLVRDLDKDTIDRLKRKAEANGRSLQQEVHEALTRSVLPTAADRARMLVEFRARHRLPKVKADPVDMVRAYREGDKS